MKQLLAAAARMEPSAGAEDLPERVMRAVQRERPAIEPSLFEQLGGLLPRVVVAALAVLAACALVEWSAGDDLTAGVVQLSEQWLFAVN